MTFTDYVSTLNHRIKKCGLGAMVDDVKLWFQPETLSSDMLAYSVGLLEYCCNRADREYPEEFAQYRTFKLKNPRFPRHVEIMRNTAGEEYAQRYWEQGIEEFKKHNICVLEVGNAI